MGLLICRTITQKYIEILVYLVMKTSLLSSQSIALRSEKYIFSKGSIKSTDHRPTHHRPLTHRSTDAIIILKRLENSKIFTLQNVNTAGEMYNHFRCVIWKVFDLLASIKNIQQLAFTYGNFYWTRCFFQFRVTFRINLIKPYSVNLSSYS